MRSSINEGIDFEIFSRQKNMILFMPSGRQNGVLYVDGLKTGTTTKLLYATGAVNKELLVH